MDFQVRVSMLEDVDKLYVTDSGGDYLTVYREWVTDSYAGKYSYGMGYRGSVSRAELAYAWLKHDLKEVRHAGQP